MNKILKFNKTYNLSLTTILKMIIPIMIMHTTNKIKMKMKTTTKMSVLLKSLQFQHIIHHKQEHQHQYTLNPLELPLELYIRDKIHILLNLL